jgi:hypothetical protein
VFVLFQVFVTEFFLADSALVFSHHFLMLTDFVCLYNYEFRLSLCKIVRSSVILLLPLLSNSEHILQTLLVNRAIQQWTHYSSNFIGEPCHPTVDTLFFKLYW